MPISAISFGAITYPPPPEAWDIHILRGQSTGNLRDLLWVTDATDTLEKPIAMYAGNDVELEFMPVFKIVRDDAQPEFKNFGIRVNKRTGRVTVGADWDPSTSPRNFIVEAYVTDNGSGIPPVKIAIAFIRVHVHLSVERIWLTPGRLSIRRTVPPGQPDDTFYQFTIRAQFDDGTIGDLTQADGLTFTPPAWFDGKSIRIPAAAPETVAPFTVRVTATAKWNGKSAEAQLEILKSLGSEPNMPTADLLEGQPDVWSGARKAEIVPNVLLLGCGFKDADRHTFKLVADTIVHKLKRDPLLQPYGYLATSMNYWGVMVPAREAGVSVRCEVQQFKEGGHLFAEVVPMPKPAPPTSKDWDIQHLIYMAGLPVPADLALVEDGLTGNPVPSADALRSFAPERIEFQPLFARWASIMRLDAPVPMIAAIEKRVVKEWVALVDRTFVDEVDNFPAISVGAPPAASRNETAILAYHDLRGRIEDDYAELFKRVKATPRNGITINLDDANGQAPEIGNLWLEPRPGFAFDNQVLVTALSNTPYGRPNFRPLGIQASLFLNTTGDDGERFRMSGLPVARAAGRNALTLQLPSQDLSLHMFTWRAFAHELSHCFGLGDEYATIPETSTLAEDTWDPNPNLMSEAGARVDGDPHKIDFFRIKWNWHRVRKASVITLPIDNKFNGTFHVFVRKGSGNQLAVGDFVRLRRRVPREPIRADPLTSIVEFRVEAIHAHNTNRPQDPFNMTIVLRNDSPLVDVTPFGPGSLVYLPIPAPEPRDLAKPYLTLVSPLAERIMTKIGGSMTGTACDITQQLSDRGGYTQVPAPPADPSINVPAKDLPQLVGAYFGGYFACGVLHPTGQCMMRDSFEDAAQFCQVCRYALVEHIDPEQHWAIDLEYEKKYRL